MKNKKLVSIIIPVYNCEKYLADCLDSVENQTYNNLEVIIINDGSKDNGIQIIEKYIKKNRGWKLINQENQGLSASRNNGFDISTGDYVFFLDSDDEIPKDAIEKLMTIADEWESDVVIGNMINYNSSGKYPNYTTKYIKEMRNIDYNKYPKLLSFIHAAGKLYKREFVKDIKFIVGVKHEDNYYNLTIYLKSNKISLIKDDVYYHRIREGNDKSITQSLNYNSFKDLLINYRKTLEENYINRKMNRILSQKIVNYIYLNINETEIKNAIKDMIVFNDFMDSKTKCSKIGFLLIKIYRFVYIKLVRIKTKR